MEKSALLSEEEELFIKDAHKKLTQCGFDAVRICTLNPEKCEPPILDFWLHSTETRQKLLISALTRDFISLNGEKALHIKYCLHGFLTNGLKKFSKIITLLLLVQPHSSTHFCR